MAEKYEGVYKLLREHAPFTTPEEMFETLGLLDPTFVSTAEYFKKTKVNDKMAYDVVEAITHNMYNQGRQMNAMASLVGLAGAGLAGGHLFVIDGGNWTLYDKMIKKAGINLRVNTKVEKIAISSAIEENQLSSFKLALADGEVFEADAVILAAPPALADLSVEKDAAPLELTAHPYQEVQTTLVVGDLRPEYFGKAPGYKMPSTIFTAASAPAPFKSIGTTGWSPDYDSRIYKIFSAEHVMTDEELDKIFVKVLDKHVHVWRGAYPVLTPNLKHLPFELDRGFYFANALETIAGSIEVETVSGANAANLCVEYLK
jgi:prenylcysteine oxidase/farnesylcysteine lyase